MKCLGEFDVEFRQLEYFCTISRLENFTRTAEVLHVSQPSVTKAIKALEAELQLTLIDRSQKHVTLTPEGKAFLLHVEKILQEIEETRQDMERFQIEKKGTIHFGIPPMVEAYLFPDLFTEFKAVYPDVKLDVKEYSDSVEVRQKAEEGELDFGIIFEAEAEDGPTEILIMTDNMSLCVNSEHPLAAADSVNFSQLRNEKFIMQQSNTYQYRNVYERCVAQGFVPDILLCTTQLKTIKQLVANKLGISILPDFVTSTETIFVRKPLDPPLQVRIRLFWGANKCLSEMDEKFIGFMRRYITTDEFQEQFCSPDAE